MTEHETAGFSLKPRQKRKLQAAADAEGLSVSALLRDLVIPWLEDSAPPSPGDSAARALDEAISALSALKVERRPDGEPLIPLTLQHSVDEIIGELQDLEEEVWELDWEDWD